MEQETIKKALESFENKRILVIGDFYLDEYITGNSESFSPEAPVPRIIIKKKEYMPGAAGNVASNFASLGAKTFACGIIGNDEQGKTLLNRLLEKQVITRGIQQHKQRVTGTFSRILLEGSGNITQHVARIDQENEFPVDNNSFNELKEYIRSIGSKVDLIFIADYDENKSHLGIVTKNIAEYCAEVAKINNIKVVGISRKNIEHFKNFDIVILNQKEAENTTKRLIKEEQDIINIGKELQDKLNVKTIIITKGRAGATLFNNEEVISMPSNAKNIVDVCGAGDALSTAFSLALVSDIEVKEALELGLISASICISKSGTANVEPEEILKYTKQGLTKNKVKKSTEIEEIVRMLKEENKKVVFTNGCFDLITDGQIELLQKAKERGDVLIVGINSDRSVKENKGPNRPILKQEERLKILASLENVDYVTVFDELTPIKLISRIKPDVLVKGGNYTKEGVVGKDIVESYNGEVVILPIIGKTADAIIDTIIKNEN